MPVAPVVTLSLPVPPVVVLSVTWVLVVVLTLVPVPVSVPVTVFAALSASASVAPASLAATNAPAPLVTLFVTDFATAAFDKLFAALIVLLSPAAALIILTSLPEFSAFTKFTAAPAVLRSELLVSVPTELNAPA